MLRAMPRRPSLTRAEFMTFVHFIDFSRITAVQLEVRGRARNITYLVIQWWLYLWDGRYC